MTTTTTGAAIDGPAPTSGGRAEPPTVHALVMRATDTYIARVQPLYLKDNPAAVAELARLRRGAGKRAHQVQDLWGIGSLEELAGLLADRQANQQANQQDFPRRADAEHAVFLASTLWALHQQSGREHGMHVKKRSLGGAVRALIRLKTESRGDSGAEEEGSPLRTRLVRVGTAESIESVAVRLREIVLLLRTAQVPLDYGLLAGQLHRWQYRPDRAAVQREWGREFHLAAPPRTKRGKGGATDDGDAIDPSLSSSEEYGGYAAGE
ncbi:MULTISPECIES: type I-E CRISPR-associated protein Cse2/CasB [unclassified Streptomyces]|uniref:type I-E CRISPR-associated protein Cse2/CasB n=1 Tax=unclassified Streptomyces TaxID=2593676 RepID=UPI00093C83D9|nr:type I-E CRISPR-associated protein Cse2/CasB [Streptomyces sp. TSRI0281]OKI32700.1 type I-E CRISPR-associated protein Cse2/CasB [Streptomyces sp. TSRI0281]